jgi:hypothetical protein
MSDTLEVRLRAAWQGRVVVSLARRSELDVEDLVARTLAFTQRPAT